MNQPKTSKTTDNLPHQQKRARRPNTFRRLRRSSQQRIIAGVVGGIAEYLQADPTWLRVLFSLSIVLSGGIMIIGYILLWLLLPTDK